MPWLKRRRTFGVFHHSSRPRSPYWQAQPPAPTRARTQFALDSSAEEAQCTHGITCSSYCVQEAHMRLYGAYALLVCAGGMSRVLLGTQAHQQQQGCSSRTSHLHCAHVPHHLPHACITTSPPASRTHHHHTTCLKPGPSHSPRACCVLPQTCCAA